MKNVNKNFLYNIIYQIFIFIIPLISTPYISRILGVNNIGIYSYTYSIVYYFMLVSMLGINNHGARTIAKIQNDKNEKSREFFSIYSIQLSLSLLMVICYIVFIFCSNSEYKLFMMIQSIYLISVIFDINWFFFGLEKFKITISRNIIIKLLSLVLIFVFVKCENDLWKYCLIMSLSTLISQMYMWLFLRKEIEFTKISFRDVNKHIKPCIILFIPVIAYSIYRVMDKTLIGLLSNTYELGFYESAEKVLNIPISIYTALGTVMLPHMSKTSDDEFSKKINYSFKLGFFTTIPILTGLFVVSKDFTILFFGYDYLKTSLIIKILLPSILFSLIANVVRTNYLIPKKMDNIYIMSTMIGAIINLIFNMIFIPIYGAIGACIGTILAEFSVMIYQLVKTRQNIHTIEITKILLVYIIKSLIMGIIIYLIGICIDNIFIKLVVQVIIGIVIYLIMNIRFLLTWKKE